MFKYFLIVIFFTLLSNTQASNKEKIIENLQNTVNLTFLFEQNINGKIENGNCIIHYPKKIYCKYQKKNKILVGDSVKILGDITYSGIVMPRYEHSDDKHIVLKLKSGYNIGLEINKIKKIELC